MSELLTRVRNARYDLDFRLLVKLFSYVAKFLRLSGYRRYVCPATILVRSWQDYKATQERHYDTYRLINLYR